MSDAPIPSQAPVDAPVADQSAPQTPQGEAQANQVLADPNASQAQKVQAVKKLKALRIKVDGNEYEERLPFEIEDTKENRDWMTKQLQMSKVSQKRMGEKAALENEVREFFSQLKANPRKILNDPNYGVDLKNLARQIIEEEIANSQKSPDQLAREKLEEEIRELREQAKSEKEDADKREYERMENAAYQQYDNQMTEALAGSDLPKSPYVIKKITDLMKFGVSRGMDITPKDVLPLVREEILKDIREMAQSMPLETIEKLFGGDILTKIRKNNIKKAKSGGTAGKAKLPDVGATKANPVTDTKDAKKTIKQLWGV